MIDRTFQLIRGVGPAREKDLWRRGVHTWSDLSRDQVILSEKLDPALHEAIDRAQALLESGEPAQLAAMLPLREAWRLLPHFMDDACYLDIECEGTSDTSEITCIGVLHRGQVRIFVNGFNLDDFPAFIEPVRLLVTFNGACFDLPVIERYFRIKLAAAHIDARFAARHAGVEGGLKSIEAQLGLERPQHLKGVSGYDAVTLWKDWRDRSDRAALQRLVEYNLYDAVQLKPVLERLYNKMRDRELSGAAPLRESERGDVLYDVTRAVLAFAA